MKSASSRRKKTAAAIGLFLMPLLALRGLESVGLSLPEKQLPETPQQLLEARYQQRWASLKEDLDWTRYHLQVVFLEGDGSGRSRVAAGLFERIAQEHSCAGALPVEAATTGGSAGYVSDTAAEKLKLAPRWTSRDVEEILKTSDLSFYDVVVCVDAEALQQLRGFGELPASVVELGDFGPYLDERRPESPMKAWVPDWRQVIDPQYDERQEAAAAPKDDALGVWLTVPEDLARLVQPRYERVRQSLSADEAKLANGLFGGDDDAAVLTYHVAGLVRFLMDSYPLDLQGGPGYCGPP